MKEIAELVGRLRLKVTPTHLKTRFKQNRSRSPMPIILLILTVGFSGCVNPRNNPIFRKVAEEEDKKSARYTEEALKKSPDLQELDQLCTKEIPLYDGFILSGRHDGSPMSTSLIYFYRSRVEYQKVKEFYMNHFSQNGWNLIRQKENGWGPDELEFRKRHYEITISHGGLGDSEYAIECEKLSDSGEPLPNRSLQAR